MHISQITLRNWKAYAKAHFDFPDPVADQNIILIGAPNGYGKTSLFEAIVLGVFGEVGFPIISGSPFSSGSESEREKENGKKEPYKTFLEKALHIGARAAGLTSCSVKLVFMDDGEPLEVQRTWHFDDSGNYQPEDEEILIYAGPTRKAVGPGGGGSLFA